MLEIVLWIVGLLAIAAALCALPWLITYMLRSMIHNWRNAPAGGSAYNPLQEFVQPQYRHITEVREQRLPGDDQGAPPPPSRPSRNQPSTDGNMPSQTGL